MDMSVGDKMREGNVIMLSVSGAMSDELTL